MTNRKPKISTPRDIITFRKSMRACGIEYFTLEKEDKSSPVMFGATGDRDTMIRVCAAIENLGYDAGSTSLAHDRGLFQLSVHVRCKEAFIGPHELTASMYGLDEDE